MRPVTVHTVISAPREQIFDFVGDLKNAPAWIDHFAEDFRLARAKSGGLGAAARFRVDPPGPHVWVEISNSEFEPPRRIVQEGRWGRVGRSRSMTVWTFEQDAGATRVELSIWTEPGHKWDAIKEHLGARRFMRREAKIMLKRLRRVFEEAHKGELATADLAGYETAKAARFGDHPDLQGAG
ncbi:MAG: SRPBCC family protein [Thermoleophilaceae bacterium]|nr:SRPBCC family protein [Thermoleophilaceae bacterium]